jgi:predicted site-specific integrase-resolvase
MHRWCDDGKIQSIIALGGKWLYARVDISRIFEDFSSDIAKKKKKKKTAMPKCPRITKKKS